MAGKQKTHSGLKKRVKVRNSGTAKVQKAAKRHLLSNKSKRQKKTGTTGLPINPTRKSSIKKLMPGKIK